jgi:hypothetical protein
MLIVRLPPSVRSTSMFACFEYAFCRSLSIVVNDTSAVDGKRSGRILGKTGAPACVGKMPDTCG